MHVWTNGTDTVIAADEASARAALAKHYDDHEMALGPMWQRGDDEQLSILEVDGPGGDQRITKTCAEWAASEPPGFLCSTEY